MRSVEIEIVRREAGAPGRLERHRIDIDPVDTLLTVLDRLRATTAPGLAFRGACRHGMCGECGVRADGEGVLACVTRVDRVLGRRARLRVEPLRGLPVLRDLVVDRTSFFASYREAKPWLEPLAEVPEREHLVAPSAVARQRRAEECVMCGICHAACPVVTRGGAFVGPAALLKSFARAVDERDAATSERLSWASTDQAAYRCHGAFACLDACPKGLDPADAIFELRRLAEKAPR